MSPLVLKTLLLIPACQDAFPHWIWEGNDQQAQTNFGGDGRLYLQITRGDTKPFMATLYQSRGRHVVSQGQGESVAEAVGKMFYAVATDAIYGRKVTGPVPL